MVASAPLTLGGFLARFAFAVLVVGATYNPTRYSFYAWARSKCTRFVGCHLLDGAGHWVQQEQAPRVSELLLDFLKQHAA